MGVPPPTSYVDPGPAGNGRYPEELAPEVPLDLFRKGAQVGPRI